jgi:hypothetical protein
LEDLQADHGDLLFLAPVGRQLAGLAEEDVVVDPVVVLHDVQPGVDLPLQVAVLQVPRYEQCALGAAGFQHRGVGGVGDVGVEPPQDRLGRRGALPDGRGVLQHEVVVVFD